YIECREWPTDYFVDQGFAHRAFYRMGLSGKVDNPDQRISDDLGSFRRSNRDLHHQAGICDWRRRYIFRDYMVDLIGDGGFPHCLRKGQRISPPSSGGAWSVSTTTRKGSRRISGSDWYTCATTSNRFSFTAANAMKRISCTTALRRWSAISSS